MKILLLKLTASALVATSSVYALNEPQALHGYVEVRVLLFMLCLPLASFVVPYFLTMNTLFLPFFVCIIASRTLSFWSKSKRPVKTG